MKPVLQQPLRTVAKRWKRKMQVQTIRGTAAKANHPESCTCLNCGTTFVGNFCPRCGQTRQTQRIRFRHIVRNMASGFFNIDHGFSRTLVDLLYRPGYMVRDYLRGKRKCYFSPFQILFVLAAIYLMVVQLVDPESLKQEPFLQVTDQPVELDLQGETEDAEKEKSPEELAMEQTIQKWVTDNAQEQKARKEKLQEEYQIPGINKPWNPSFKLPESSFLQRVWDLLVGWFTGNKAFQILTTVPIFACATRWAISRRKRKPWYNLTELVVAQTYFGAQTLLLSILAVLYYGNAAGGDIYDLPAVFIFAVFCLNNHQLFQLTWKKSFWKTLQMFLCSMLIVILLACFAVLGIIIVYPIAEILFPNGFGL